MTEILRCEGSADLEPPFRCCPGSCKLRYGVAVEHLIESGYYHRVFGLVAESSVRALIDHLVVYDTWGCSLIGTMSHHAANFVLIRDQKKVSKL